MIWRHELKYIIDEATFQHLFFELRPVLHADIYSQPQQGDDYSRYHIRSLYFDDAGKSGIFDKLTGADPRHKFRIRIYNHSDKVIRLEKKIKRGRMTRKHSTALSRGQVDRLLAGDVECLLENVDLQGKKFLPLAGEFYADMRTRLLRPQLLVDYERLPLTWPDGNVRITFDRFLSTGFFRQDLWDDAAALQPVLVPGQMIMEVKYDHFLPDFIRTLLPLAGASPLAVSKYVQCAASCRMESWEDQI